MPETAAPTVPDELRRRVLDHPFWYHTIDLAPGLTTPGWFDLRPALDRLPWPALAGKRCLDIGTYDGHLAFEMERRGAAEVVAVDIEDHDLWDWPPDARKGLVDVGARDIAFEGTKKGDGFRLAAEVLDSKVDWRPISIYDLDPDEIGEFDVITCGTLLLHLRDPIRALEAVRTVCRGHFLSSEQIELWTTVLGRGRPLFKLNGSGGDCQWWLANAAGHYRMLYAAGFEIERISEPYVVAYHHHPMPQPTMANRARAATMRRLTGMSEEGVFHRALLGRPRVGPHAR